MHHLFPSIQPHHYVDLYPMALQTFKEYNIPYICFDTFFDAVKSHWKHMEQFQVLRERYFEKLNQKKKSTSFHLVDIGDYIIRYITGSKKNIPIIAKE
jgi:hypothetical protein